MVIAEAKIQALTDELADTLRRQGLDPKPFLDRLRQRSSEATQKALRQRDRSRRRMD